MLPMNVQEQWKSFLNKHAIFSLLGEHATGRLVQQLEMVSFAIGEIVMVQRETESSSLELAG